MTGEPLLRVSSVVKNYSGLRPLRVTALSVAAADRIAIAGIDASGAEVLVNLITGATLPDEGEVHVFGRRTADLESGDQWLASLDNFGIVSDRAVLLEAATVAQNLALPFTLEIDPINEDTRLRVQALAEACDIALSRLDQRADDISPDLRVRIHLARAIALGPRLLLMEHPTAALAEPDRAPFGRVVERVCAARALTMVAITADSVFAAAAAQTTLTLQPASGQLVAARRSWWRRS